MPQARRQQPEPEPDELEDVDENDDDENGGSGGEGFSVEVHGDHIGIEIPRDGNERNYLEAAAAMVEKLG